VILCLTRFARRLLVAVLYSACGAAVTLLVVAVLYMEKRPDLAIWHTADLDEEFTEISRVDSFADYLALEERLFAQLHEQVYAKVPASERRLINRYDRNSLSDPERWSPNWNRSFELAAARPKAAVLLLHGMSDSPYSLRTLGQTLNAAGATVLGMRMPGHGTAPSGLVEITWQDMAAAVRLAMRHLATRGRRAAAVYCRLLDRRCSGGELRAGDARRRRAAESRWNGPPVARDRGQPGGGIRRLAGAARSPPGAREACLDLHSARVRPLQVRLFCGERGRCGLPPDAADPAPPGHPRRQRQARRFSALAGLFFGRRRHRLGPGSGPQSLRPLAARGPRTGVVRHQPHGRNGTAHDLGPGRRGQGSAGQSHAALRA
jgi:hypothetical protein